MGQRARAFRLRPSRRAAVTATIAIVAATMGVSGQVASAGAPSATPTRAAAGIRNVPPGVLAASAAPGHPWTPEPASYGVGERKDVAVTGCHGTTLRANVYYPVNRKTGAPASGPFPVAMTQTPYGKAGAGRLEGQAGKEAYLVKRGYLDAVVDVRGTGNSRSRFGLVDPIQQCDSVKLVHWAARLPHSSGKVGLYGASYLGINQLLTAGHVGKHSPLKAIFPVVSANDIYRDTGFMGGILDIEFGAAYLALTSGLNLLNPVLNGLTDPRSLTHLIRVELDHVLDEATFDVPFIARTLAGGATAYDGHYWQARNPAEILPKIVDNGVAAYLVGGEYDLFQRGEPANYAQLQNLWAGRPQYAPMQPGQPTTGRYQLWVGPFTHLTGSLADFDPLLLRWFDTWLKGIDTGMAQTPTPLHYYDLGTKSYAETADFPFEGVTPTTFYFSGTRAHAGALSFNHGTLTTERPTASRGSDTVVKTPTGVPCTNSTDQWAAGPLRTIKQLLRLPDLPCIDGDRLSELGPGVLTYTTQPFEQARVLGGPIAASIYAKATTAESEWVVNVEDVSPNGRSRPLTEGALLGSLRAVDNSRSWKAPDGQYLLPYHPYTKASQHAVPRGKTTRYDIEIFPTRATIPAGHRIRVTLSTSDTPHLLPTLPEQARLLGGIYRVQRTAAAPSSIELPLSGPPVRSGATTR